MNIIDLDFLIIDNLEKVEILGGETSASVSADVSAGVSAKTSAYVNLPEYYTYSIYAIGSAIAAGATSAVSIDGNTYASTSAYTSVSV